MKITLIIVGLIASLTFFSNQAFSAKLEKVDSFVKDGAFVAELTFDDSVKKDQVTVDYINETVQVNIADTALDKSISTKVEDEKVRTIYSYRLDDGSIRSRIIYQKGIKATAFQDLTSVSADNNKVIIKVADRGALPEKKVVVEAVSDEDLLKATQWIQEADKTAEAKKELDKKKESEIPVLAAAKSEKSTAKPASTSRILWSLGLVLALLFGFSVFLKRFIKKSPAKKNSQIKVLTQHYLGPKKSLAIIRVAGESMLIGVTDQNINLIKSLALLDEEIPHDTSDTFSRSLENNMGEANEENDEFSISKIKDFVSDRLKNMKEI